MDERNKEMRERSGAVSSRDPFVGVFYDLLRDHVQPADLERVVRENLGVGGDEMLFCNGWLAAYAQDLVNRLRDTPTGTTVYLDDASRNKVRVIKAIREHKRVSLKDAKAIIDSVPTSFEVVDEATAAALVSAINAAGGVARRWPTGLRAMSQALEEAGGGSE